MIGRTGLLKIETYHTCICGSFKPLKIIIHVRTVVFLFFLRNFYEKNGRTKSQSVRSNLILSRHCVRTHINNYREHCSDSL